MIRIKEVQTCIVCEKREKVSVQADIAITFLDGVEKEDPSAGIPQTIGACGEHLAEICANFVKLAKGKRVISSRRPL